MTAVRINVLWSISTVGPALTLRSIGNEKEEYNTCSTFQMAKDTLHSVPAKTDPDVIFTLEVFSAAKRVFGGTRCQTPRIEGWYVHCPAGAKRTRKKHFSPSTPRKFLRFLGSRHHVRIRSPNRDTLGYLPLYVDRGMAAGGGYRGWGR